MTGSTSLAGSCEERRGRSAGGRFPSVLQGFEEPWDDLVHDCKLFVLSSSLSADLHRLVERMAEVCEDHRRHSDHTRRELRECLAEVIACYGVYRTYVVPGRKPSEADVARSCAGPW